MKTRVLLSSLMLIVLAISSSAQDQPEVKPGAKPDEKPQLELKGNVRDLSIEYLIKWWCEWEKVNVMYQPSQVAPMKVSFQVPEDGTKIPSEKLPQLVADTLEQFRLCLVEVSENRYSIVPATEAATVSPILDVEAARKAPNWKYIVVRIPLRFSDANMLRAALQNLVSRSGGTVNPIQLPSYLLIGERADRAQRLIDTIEAIETEGARQTVKVYDLPAGVSATNVVAGFSTIVGQGAYGRTSPPASAVSDSIVVVRGSPEQIALCDDLLKQLVAKAEASAAESRVVARRYEVARAPSEMAESVERLFKGKVLAAAVPGANAVIVRATAATHDEVKAALELMK